MANEKRLIDVDAHIEEVCKDCGCGCELDKECCILVGDLMAAPTVDAVEVVHGRWEYMHDSIFNCTNCGSIHIVETSMGNPKWRYCPNCGAKMDGDGNDI